MGYRPRASGGTPQLTFNGEGKVTLFQLPGVTSLTHTIAIANDPALVSVDLGNLQTFGASGATLYLNANSALETIDLSSLVSTAASSAIDARENNSLTTVDLSALQDCTGSIYLLACPSLSNLLIGPLASCNGQFRVDSSGIASLSFPAMATCIGGITASNCPDLTSFSADSITNLPGYIVANNCPSLASFSMSSLGIIYAGAELQMANSGLTTVALNSLTSVYGLVNFNNSAIETFSCGVTHITSGGSIKLAGCTSLTSVSFGAFVEMTGTIDVTGCTSLSTAQIDAVVISAGSANVISSDTQVKVSGCGGPLSAGDSGPVDLAIANIVGAGGTVIY